MLKAKNVLFFCFKKNPIGLIFIHTCSLLFKLQNLFSEPKSELQNINIFLINHFPSFILLFT